MESSNCSVALNYASLSSSSLSLTDSIRPSRSLLDAHYRQEVNRQSVSVKRCRVSPLRVYSEQ